jgi:uncharacterized protein with HEPN domain
MPDRSTRPEVLYLREMLDAATAIRDIIGARDLDALRADSVRRDAVLWNYTVLGEAAAQLPADFKASHPDVRWVQPARVRNRIVHGYFDIALSILHTAAANDLPSLSEHLATLIAKLEQGA